jgi:hypothetical protein
MLMPDTTAENGTELFEIRLHAFVGGRVRDELEPAPTWSTLHFKLEARLREFTVGTHTVEPPPVILRHRIAPPLALL